MGAFHSLLVVVVLVLAGAACASNNMNGEYLFSTTPHGTKNLVPKEFNDWPGKIEYFDAYSPPISTLYSQVWWSPLAPAKLPQAMVEKFSGKVAAIVGWEIDQVRKGAGPNGEDVSVPISASYNHHYTNQIIGAGSKFKKVHLTGPNDPLAQDLRRKSGHGMLPLDQPVYVAEPNPGETAEPSHQFFSSGNGGEYRKTFHGFAPGYALLVNSPTEFQVTPMQIDTWHREKMNISGPTPPRFVPGPLPRASLAPKGAIYSGLLECPLTTRVVKQVDGAYSLEPSACSQPILTFQECFAAAVTLFGPNHTFANNTVADDKIPAGCSATIDASNPFGITVTFNKKANAAAKCTAGNAKIGATASVATVTLSLDSDDATITIAGPSNVWFGVGFGASAMADEPWSVVVDGEGTVTERKLANHAAGTLLDTSVKVVSNSVSSGVRSVVLSRPLKGKGADYFTFDLNTTVFHIITAVGSSAAFGFHKDKAPAKLTMLPVDADSCVCPEQPAAFGQATGSLVYHQTAQAEDVGTGSVGFGKQKCARAPATILNEMRNPTCDIRHYQGGQWACHHMWSLLDADQAIPWANEPLVFHHKYRFWVQEYDTSLHVGVGYGFTTQMLVSNTFFLLLSLSFYLYFSILQIGSPWEFDVPACSANVKGCALENGTWVHTISGSTMGDKNLVSLNCNALFFLVFLDI